MANTSNYKVEAKNDSQNRPVLYISWQGSTNPTKVKIGFQNNNYSGYGYGMWYGDTADCKTQGWGTGSAPVSQATFANDDGQGFTLPLYIRPSFLTNPTGPVPQGNTLYSSFTPSTSGPAATAVSTGNDNVGIMIGVSASGGGGPMEA